MKSTTPWYGDSDGFGSVMWRLGSRCNCGKDIDGVVKISYAAERTELLVCPMAGDASDASKRLLIDSYSLYRIKGSANGVVAVALQTAEGDISLAANPEVTAKAKGIAPVLVKKTLLRDIPEAVLCQTSRHGQENLGRYCLGPRSGRVQGFGEEIQAVRQRYDGPTLTNPMTVYCTCNAAYRRFH